MIIIITILSWIAIAMALVAAWVSYGEGDYFWVACLIGAAFLAFANIRLWQSELQLRKSKKEFDELLAEIREEITNGYNLE